MPIPFLGAVVGGARALASRGVIRGTVGRILGGAAPAARRAGAAAVRAAPAVGTGVAIARMGGGGGPSGGPPPLPPGFGPGGGRPAQPGVGGIVRRILPGGRSGYEFDAYPDAAVDRYGRPLAVHPQAVERIRCPSGYVAVDLDGDGQNDACMLKGAARAAGLWSPRPKPPISGTDARAIRRARRAQERVKRLAQDVGYTVRTTKGGGRFK